MFDWLNDLPEYLQYAIALAGALASMHTAAGVITTMTPTQVDDRIHGRIGRWLNGTLRLLNNLALNVGRNRNADDPASPRG